jgi:predicted phosphoribosyltransferase
MFLNREEAGVLLAKKLINYSNKFNAVVVAIPRGGVPVGAVIAKQLQIPLEIVMSKKIGHPINKEYAIGAVTLESRILSEFVPGISKRYIANETSRIRKVLKERYKTYYGKTAPLSLRDKNVIIVDDGVATGNTLISSIQLIRKQKPLSIVVALPVAPKTALKKIKELKSVVATICLLTPYNFHAVGQFYEEFNQVNDQEVIQLLKDANTNLVPNL